jgi:hypothetical protein
MMTESESTADTTVSHQSASLLGVNTATARPGWVVESPGARPIATASRRPEPCVQYPCHRALERAGSGLPGGGSTAPS